MIWPTLPGIIQTKKIKTKTHHNHFVLQYLNQVWQHCNTTHPSDCVSNPLIGLVCKFFVALSAPTSE
eukprot:2895979-Amphidinium_carterae.1